MGKKSEQTQPRECEILDSDLRSQGFEPMVCDLEGNLEQVWLMVNLPTRSRVSAVANILTSIFSQHPVTQFSSRDIFALTNYCSMGSGILFHSFL